MGAIALLVFYGKYMVTLLMPAFSQEFAVLPDSLGWFRASRPRSASQERLLYYDDAEEGFGVGIPDEDGVLRNWGNYGPLVKAVLVLTEDSTDA